MTNNKDRMAVTNILNDVERQLHDVLEFMTRNNEVIERATYVKKTAVMPEYVKVLNNYKNFKRLLEMYEVDAHDDFMHFKQ